jgi:hypothetical protein
MTRPALSDRDAYVLEAAPTIMSAILARDEGRDANSLADTAIHIAHQIWETINREQRPSNDYLLDHLPRVLAGFILRRRGLAPGELLLPAFKSTQRVYDLIDRHAPYLLDCPFCGHPPKFTTEGTGQVVVLCSSDDCRVQPQTTAASEQEAAMQWNRRRR